MKQIRISSPNINKNFSIRPLSTPNKYCPLILDKLAFGIVSVLCLLIGLSQGIKAEQVSDNCSDSMQKTIQPTNEKLDLSWSDVQNLSKQLSEILKGSEWTGILAITRGGLFPAGLLSHSLDIRRIETINVHSYTPKNTQGELNLLNVPYIPNSGKNWIIVDDLVDSGKTMRAVRKIYPKAVAVTLFAKPEGLPTVDYHIRKVEQNTWIVFPWEKDAPKG